MNTTGAEGATRTEHVRLSRKGGERWRSPLERDYDIVLYSSAWRRLRGVTQVTPITDGISRAHDRMTHSLKVAQVGQRLAQSLRHSYPTDAVSIEPLAVMVAGMAHDLGHPPFGHVAEKELQNCLRTERHDPYEGRENPWALSDSFEGNAQTFRILTSLSKKSHSQIGGEVPDFGMDLTVTTLAASMKYPWAHKGRPVPAEENPGQTKYFEKKWGYYDSEAETWQAVRELVPPDAATGRSLNAWIMDLADDVTYAVHDVTDYFRLGFIPLHEIGAGFRALASNRANDIDSEFGQFFASATASLYHKSEADVTPETLARATKWLGEFTSWPVRAYGDSRNDRQLLHAFESSIVRAIQSSTSVKNRRIVTPIEQLVGLEILKELTWYYVINHPYLSASQQGQRRIIRDLHSWLCEWASEAYEKSTVDHAGAKTARNLRRLPTRFHDLLTVGQAEGRSQNEWISRAAVDFIVGLTDAEAASLHQHMGGTSAVVAPVMWL